MPVLEVPAHAKINLSLDVLNKRPDGYHDLRTIMQTVDLYDIIRLETIDSEGLELECDLDWLPLDERNTAWRAANLFVSRLKIRSGLKIKISKKIPVAAGLAGGSADAAAVLRGLNNLFSTGLDNTELGEMARQLGADVTYCISGGTKLAEGIGELLSPLPDFSGVDLVLVKPHVGVSTPWVYGNLKLDDITDDDRPDTTLLRRALAQRDLDKLAAHMKNVLELVTIPRYSIVKDAKSLLMDLGALGSMMSGSGPTVFGIFPNRSSAFTAFKALAEDSRWQCFLTNTTGEQL
ncbi:MAG: 4-(cytidine 5'-diphospho)-2-C-methyl-D-erythritol kinase [Clostridiaceae bacterium]|nr:4-(cytidine 5'-diphospho)-2-C-methyl-D-erythritol kinase [Clostridiaceae bacterium]